MPLSYRVYLSAFPLGSSEPARVLAAIRADWVSPSWVSSRALDGAWLFEMQAEACAPDADEAALAERLTLLIWRKLGRYVKVVVDVSPGESDEARRRELGQTEYRKLMRLN